MKQHKYELVCLYTTSDVDAQHKIVSDYLTDRKINCSHISNRGQVRLAYKIKGDEYAHIYVYCFTAANTPIIKDIPAFLNKQPLLRYDFLKVDNWEYIVNNDIDETTHTSEQI